MGFAHLGTSNQTGSFWVSRGLKWSCFLELPIAPDIFTSSRSPPSMFCVNYFREDTMAPIRFLLLVLLILNIFGCRLALGQTDLDEKAADLFERISNERDNLKFFVDYSGNLILCQEDGQVPPFSQFFAGEFVASSLNIKLPAVAKLEKLAKLYVESELRRKMLSVPKDKSTSDSPMDELVSKVKACIGPERFTRLLEIQQQSLEARNGILANASDSRLLDRELRKSVFDFLVNEEKRILAESLDIWLEPLNEQQRKLFDSEWSFDKRIGSLAFMAVSLDYKAVHEVDRTLNPKRSEFLFPNVAIYSLGVDGNLMAKVPDIPRKRSDLSKCYAAMHILFSVYTTETLNIQAKQVAKLNEIKSKFQKQKNQITAQLAEDFLVTVRHHHRRVLDNGEIDELVLYDWPEDMTEINLESERRLNPNAKTCLADMLDVLIPHQLEALKIDFQNVAIRSLGPVAEMDHGTLKKLLNLTNQQEEQLEKNRGDSLAYIQKETLTVFAEAQERLHTSLSAERKVARKRALGKTCDFKRRDIGIWASLLILNKAN